MLANVKEDATLAAGIATVVTVVTTAFEAPIVLVYLGMKMLVGFVGAVIGLVTYRLAAKAWRKGVEMYKARKQN